MNNLKKQKTFKNKCSYNVTTYFKDSLATMSLQNFKGGKSMTMQIRVTDEQHETIKANAKANGFETVSAFIKYVALNCKVSVTDRK